MIIKTISLVASIVLIIAVLLQDSKSAGLGGSIDGGAEQLFGQKRGKAYDVVLHRVTIVASIVFFGVAVLGVFISV